METVKRRRSSRTSTLTRTPSPSPSKRTSASPLKKRDPSPATKRKNLAAVKTISPIGNQSPNPVTKTISTPPFDTPKYTWKQVAQHNTQDDMWVTIDDKVYDVTSWVDKHPGGIEMLRLVAGRDITVAFDNYHPFTKKHYAVLPKYYVADLVPGSYEFPPYKKDSGFYADIKQEVGDYFRDNGIDSKNPWNGLWRMVLVVAVCLGCFYYLFHPSATDLSLALPTALSLPPLLVDAINTVASYDANTHTLTVPLVTSTAYRFLIACLMGICQALPLLHVMHDCSHTAWGHSQSMWYCGGRFFLDFYAGCNMTSWHNQHTIGHHIYTNIFGCDPDLPKEETGDIRRLVSRQLMSEVAKWQHIYLPLLYGLLGISMRISDVSQVYTAQINGPMRVNDHGLLGHMEHIISKACFAYWRIYLPLAVWGADPSAFWVSTAVIELMTGYWLAYNFQVSHISTAADFPLSDKHGDAVQYEWAIAQTLSSVDYSHTSWWTTFCCGALNYQIEHHLLPSVSQYHYPAIAPIVKKVCAKHNVRYNYFEDFYQAFYAHIHYLYVLGHDGKVVPLPTGLH